MFTIEKPSGKRCGKYVSEKKAQIVLKRKGYRKPSYYAIVNTWIKPKKKGKKFKVAKIVQLSK